jgi:hypothetical protein
MHFIYCTVSLCIEKVFVCSQGSWLVRHQPGPLTGQKLLHTNYAVCQENQGPWHVNHELTANEG